MSDMEPKTTGAPRSRGCADDLGNGSGSPPTTVLRMTITTSLHPGLTTSKPGTPVPLALRLHNPDQVVQVVTLRPIGGLAEFTVVEPSSVELQPHASIEVPAVISVPPSFAPGLHSSEI